MIQTNFYSEKKSVSTENKYLVFTLLPTSITGAVVSPVKNGKPKVFFTITERLVYDGEVDSNDFVKKYLINLDRICSKIAYNLEKDTTTLSFLDSAFVFMTEPWVDSNIYDLVDERVLPFTVDKEYLEKIQMHTEDQLINGNKKVFKDYVSSKANGYNINFSNFISNSTKNKNLQKLEMNILEQGIKDGLVDSARYIIEKNFVLSDIIFDSYFAPVLHVSSKIFPQKSDQILLNVYKEFTLMRVFLDSRLDSITKIPLGTNKIIKKIKKLKSLSDYNEAVKIFDSVRNSNSIEKDNDILKMIDEHKKDYISFINKSLSNYKPYQISPNILLISSDKRSLLIDDKSIFGPNVKHVNDNFIDNFVQFSNKKYFDTHTAVAVMYLFSR